MSRSLRTLEAKLVYRPVCPLHIYPELGARVVYAVKVVYSLPDLNFKRLTMLDLVDALDKSKKPIVIVIKQDFPPEILPKVGLYDGQMTSTLKACGTAGVVTNGPTRDVNEIRELDFQYIRSGVTPGHGDMAIHAINVPVSVAGMDVALGELIHMDENGACKFPTDRLADICKKVETLVKGEDERAKALSQAKNAEEVKAVYTRR